MTVVVDASVAWRKSRCCEVSPDQAKAMIQGLPSLFDHLTPYGELAERALEIAVLIEIGRASCRERVYSSV